MKARRDLLGMVQASRACISDFNRHYRHWLRGLVVPEIGLPPLALQSSVDTAPRDRHDPGVFEIRRGLKWEKPLKQVFKSNDALKASGVY